MPWTTGQAATRMRNKTGDWQWPDDGGAEGCGPMLFSDLPFTKLRSVLLDLGFVERVLEGKYLGFYHAGSDTLFAFRMCRPRDKVSLADLVGVRKQLAWRGLLSEEAFDAALCKASA